MILENADYFVKLVDFPVCSCGGVVLLNDDGTYTTDASVLKVTTKTVYDTPQLSEILPSFSGTWLSMWFYVDPDAPAKLYGCSSLVNDRSMYDLSDDAIRDYIHEGKLKSAVTLCTKYNSPVARLVQKGIERIGRPLSDIQTAVENVGNAEVARLEKGLPILATIAGGAPMIGFLGTVLGMVQAFFNMSQAGNNIDITLLSSGIYTAMITTVGGLIVGILAYFGYNYLSSNISDLVFKMESATIDFMDLLHEPAEKAE